MSRPHSQTVTSFLERLSFTTPRGQWLSIGFVFVVLLLLVALPLLLSQRTHAVLSQLTEQTDVATSLGDEIHSAFSRELAAIVGFQKTGDANYIEFYESEERKILASVADLESLTVGLGRPVEDSFKELQSAIENWHKDVQTNRLVMTRLPQGEFRDLIFDRLLIIRRAHEATTAFTGAITEYKRGQRLAVERLAYNFTIVSAVVGSLAFLSLALIALMFRRLRISNFILYNQMREEEELRELGQGLTGAFYLHDVLTRITGAALLKSEAEGVYIEMVDIRRNQLTCVAGRGSHVPPPGVRSSFEGSLAQEVLQNRQPRIIANIASERNRKSPLGELARGSGDLTTLVIPLVAEDQPLGAIFVIRKRPHRFVDTEFRLVRILADMASISLLRALTREQLRRAKDEEHFVAEMAEVLASSLDYRETLKTVVRLAVPRIAFACTIHLIEHDRIHIAEIAHSDSEKNSILGALRDKYPRSMNGGVVGPDYVIRTGQPAILPEITEQLLRNYSVDEGHFDLLYQLNFKSGMIVPMIASGETLGSLTLLSDEPRHYSEDDLPFAQNIARHAALAVQNARLYLETQHAIQLRDEILRTVSHDLKNPVNNIHLTATMLSTPSVPEEKRQLWVHMIQRTTQRMNDLIENLTAVARLREGHEMPLNLHTENPGDVIEEVCDAFDSQARAKSIELCCDKSRELPAIVVDHGRILQVFSNLVGNAVKFTPSGGRIVVACEPFGRQVRFTVKDTGCGIDPKDLGRIFDLFWQAKPTAHMGTGFGLAIAKSIVEQHKGRIWAESQPGLGTTFFFTLPQAESLNTLSA